MKYLTFNPSDDLTSIVKCYWILEGSKEDLPERQRIVPDGCIEMIFHHGDLYRQYLPDNSFIIQPRCFVFGQLTNPLEIESTGTTGIFAVRFQPYGFKPISPLPIKSLENRAVPLTELFTEAGVTLSDLILKQSVIEDKIKIVEHFIMGRLMQDQSIDTLIKSTIELIVSTKGAHPINDLSDQMQIKKRQLQRKFSSKVGITPKQLSQIIRLQATLSRLLNGDYNSLTSLAYEEGFFDQAHFIKEFKQFTGQTPKDFYKDNLKLSSFFHGKD